MAKRIIDLVGASVALALLAPVMVVVAGLVRVKLGPQVLFTQARAGRHGRPFTLIKFRSMLDLHDADGRPLPNAERLTAFGRALRSTSLDELPTLWNVVRGEMSLVGPRPLLLEYVPLYDARQARRLEVTPGITGWAQVNGRNALSWEEKFVLDVWYVDHRSLALDLAILWRTIAAVARRRGITHGEDAAMPRFEGRPPS